jgi:2-polyprenyl-3-methyl-5-hydroxy-6-metoxy-1,4-benzoquinol methylase
MLRIIINSLPGKNMDNQAKEKQNQMQFDNYKTAPVQLGPYTTHIWNSDPRHLCFLLSRYKFCAKMFEGKDLVLEIGCGDAFGLPIVAQTVKKIHAIDWEPLLMEDNKRRLKNINCSFSCLDITKSVPDGKYDAVYALDVIEHIPAVLEESFFKNLSMALKRESVCIIGTPNITANQYATEQSREGHVNLKTHKELRELMSKYFSNVFMFSMNDEVVHTGYGPMAHYLLAMGVGLR